MSNLTISVEVLAGTSIEDAVQEAKDLCIKLDVAYVTFWFNDVKFSVGKNADTSPAGQKFVKMKLLKKKQTNTDRKFVIMNDN